MLVLKAVDRSDRTARMLRGIPKRRHEGQDSTDLLELINLKDKVGEGLCSSY